MRWHWKRKTIGQESFDSINGAGFDLLVNDSFSDGVNYTITDIEGLGEVDIGPDISSLTSDFSDLPLGDIPSDDSITYNSPTYTSVSTLASIFLLDLSSGYPPSYSSTTSNAISYEDDIESYTPTWSDDITGLQQGWIQTRYL